MASPAPRTAGPPNDLPQLHQLRLSHYWTISRRHKPTTFPFMDLPLSIRCSVYFFLGLPVDEFISLNKMSHSAIDDFLLSGGDEHNPEPCSVSEYDEKAPWNGPISSLLLVSITISNEIRNMFFSQNVFFISQGRWGSLKQLLDIGASGWRDLRALVVLLQPCRCLTAYCTYPFCDLRDSNHQDELYDEMTDIIRGGYFERKKNTHHRPLNDADYNDRQTLLQWEAICDGIAAHGQPNRLVLLLAAMVDDVDTARRVIEPLFALPRPLDVKISFGKPEKNQKALRELAMDAVLRAVDPPPSPDPKPLPFLELPVELQVMILEHTCLRRYTRLVNCQRVGFHWFINRSSCEDKHLEYTDTDYPDDVVHTRQETALIDNWLGPNHIFCQRVTTSFHKGCADHHPTLALCLVSRHFRELVKEVFYSSLEFEVCGWTGQPQSFLDNADTDPNSCAPWAFLNFMRRHEEKNSLRYIKKLTLLFPPMTAEYLGPEREAWQLWLETINYLATQATVHDLKLTVCFAMNQVPWSGMVDRWDTLSSAKVEKLYETYECIIEPLQKLGALKALFVLVPGFGRGGDAVRRQRLMEAKLERIAMGDDYDSSVLGKPVGSVWVDVRYPWQEY